MGSKMKFLIIGLGSMGKRRIRNLLALGITEIAGYDIREDRIKEAKQKYSIRTYSSFEQACKDYIPDVFVISTPPDKHIEYAYFGYKNNIHCFIEASVTDANKILELYNLTKDKHLIFAPSCTMRYYPGPKKVRELLEAGLIGDVLNINYHSGQYLPDWHTWERIEDYYVSKRETGGCREIVPFELTWMNDIWGIPSVLGLIKDKLTNINADIDDIYHCILRYNKIICNLTIDVIARPKAVRELRILGTEGILEWSSESNYVRYLNINQKDWIIFNLEKGSVELNYINPEEPYVNEMKDFVDAIRKNDKSLFPNDLKKDFEVLKILLDLESLNKN